MKISLEGKKFVIATSFNTLWRASDSKLIELDRIIVGDKMVFTSYSNIDARFTDFDRSTSIHLFPWAYGYTLIGPLDRLAPNVAKYCHTSDQEDVWGSWIWGECIDTNGMRSDLANYLAELPLTTEQKALVDDMQKRAFAGMLNP